MKELTIIFFSSWKFAATFPIAILGLRMSAAETLIYTNIGGILGTFLFVYFSDSFLKIWTNYGPKNLRFRKQKKKIFTKRNRRFVTLKAKYGLWGIVVLSPVVLSIPLGSFLTVKYYGLKISNVMWLITGQIVWSMIYTYFYTMGYALLH